MCCWVLLWGPLLRVEKSSFRAVVALLVIVVMSFKTLSRVGWLLSSPVRGCHIVSMDIACRQWALHVVNVQFGGEVVGGVVFPTFTILCPRFSLLRFPLWSWVVPVDGQCAYVVRLCVVIHCCWGRFLCVGAAN